MHFRKATRADLPAIVHLLAQDILGQKREAYQDPLPNSYYEAFDRIDADPNQELIVAENANQEVIGTLQLTILPSLSYQGSSRALIEAVRVREDHRGGGIGGELLQWTIGRARARGARMLQLTSDKQRVDAVRFYEKLGFKASHEGLKMFL
ncbi:GNAT family N-acetyltransferase [Parachryseolinea silvisoli]|uniref:GNAT family N-acetyltransferase n=1 Tax=Parachryseolinea silvisoli TaxID=2873601 RepID=UPI002265EDB1|nr:GNAT family N-acetyltransferase [Parachryseolinea silvisoli]MCD9015909.1 GNAT family N-acetyltransferase [Parachryseolinea silvisoli]